MTSIRAAGRTVLAPFTLMALLAAGLLGCVPSLDPLYTADTLREDDRILGAWRQVLEGEDDEEQGTVWTVVKTSTNAYRLTVVPDEYDERSFGGEAPRAPDPADFELRLVKLGDRLFADVMPARAPVRNDMYQYHLLRTHTAWLISIADGRISMAGIDPDWLEPRLERGEIEIAHAMVDDEVVFTAATPQLQHLYGGLPEEAFSDPLVFVRR